MITTRRAPAAVTMLLGFMSMQPAQGGQTVLWTQAGEELNFSNVAVAFSPAPGVLTGSGAGILEESPIGDGQALILWDLNTSGRVDLRHETAEPEIALIQYRFQAYIESGSTGNNSVLLRLGNGSALSSVANAAISVELRHDGILRFEFNDGAGGRTGMNHPVGLDTPFEVSLVVNATGTAAAYAGPGGSRELAPAHYDIYVDDEPAGVDLPLLGAYAGTGITRMWFMSGTSSASIAPTVHLDNIILYTDGDVAVPPGGVDTFWGRTVVAGYIDSGSWLGWLYVDAAPWIYSVVLDKWIYCPQGPDADITLGAWAYFLR